MRCNIKCVICGNLFNSARHHATYCSDTCKKIGAKERRKELAEITKSEKKK